MVSVFVVGVMGMCDKIGECTWTKSCRTQHVCCHVPLLLARYSVERELAPQKLMSPFFVQCIE